MISNILVGLITGAVSSWVVSRYFYKLGRLDADSIHHRAQLDSILLRLKFLDPKRRNSARPGDGVDDTVHWMICFSEIMAETGFQAGADELQSIIHEMNAFCPAHPRSPAPTYDEGETTKKKWEARIQSLYPDTPH